MVFPRPGFVLLVSCCALLAAPVSGQLEMPAVFSDHMVLQRGSAVPVWGTASPRAPVTVSFRHQTVKTRADADGAWRVDLGPFDAGGPDQLAVSEKKRLVFRDVLVGEVWVCSGQSNMEWSLRQARDAEREVAAAEYPRIRLFRVKRVVASEPRDDVSGSWLPCTPETAKNFSAVGYFFGRALASDLDVPIGLVQSAWGGTPAESWTSQQGLDAQPDLAPLLERWAKVDADYAAGEADWNAAVAKAKADGKRAPRRPRGPHDSHHPAGLYNGMIAPLVPYGIRGAIWYQGESNANRAFQYRKLFSSMITDWRRAWGQGDFPFLFVQLANFQVSRSATWAELREAQTMALQLPATGMAVAIDIGNPKDIHPRNKQEVGRRLALWAMGTSYERDVVYSGPLYDRSVVQPDRITVHFKHVGGGLAVRGGGELKGFVAHVGGGKFKPVAARIVGDTVVVETGEQPIHVRYAYSANPAAANLINAEGLPASPFRTDDFPCITLDAKW